MNCTMAVLHVTCESHAYKIFSLLRFRAMICLQSPSHGILGGQDKKQSFVLGNSASHFPVPALICKHTILCVARRGMSVEGFMPELRRVLSMCVLVVTRSLLKF